MCSGSDAFKPSDATLIDIDYVFEVYHNPINPMSKPKLQTCSTGNYSCSTRRIQRSSPQRSVENSKHKPETESYESQPSKYYADQQTSSCRGPSIEFVNLNHNYLFPLSVAYRPEIFKAHSQPL